MGFDPTMAVKSQYPGQRAYGASRPHEPSRGSWPESKLPRQARGDDAVVFGFRVHAVFGSRANSWNSECVGKLLGTWRGCREGMPGNVSGPILVALKSAGAGGRCGHVSSGHGSRRAWGTMVSCLFGADDARKRTPDFLVCVNGSRVNGSGRLRQKTLSQKLAKGCTWVKKAFTLVRSR